MSITTYEEKGRKYMKIDNVTFGKLSIRFPENKYQSTEKIFRAECVVEKKDYKELKKMFKKGSFEEIDTESFAGRLKFEPPFPDDDEQYVTRFSAKTTYKDKKTGEEKLLEDGMELRPKIWKVLEDGNEEDVTKTKYINNGSKGWIIIAVSETSFGTMAYLKSVHLPENSIVEYIKDVN